MDVGIRCTSFRVLSVVFFLLISLQAKTQEDCASLTLPVDGATNVAVDTQIAWEPQAGVFGYSISLGTSPGGVDIANNVSVGNTPSFTPSLGLPESSTIYVTISILIDQTTTITCNEQSFTTENVTTIPGCTQLNFPANGSVDVSLDPILSWSYASKATGYRLSVGTFAGGTDVINNQNLGNVLSFNFANDLQEGTTYYVTLAPYNENGSNTACVESSFTTLVIGDEIPMCTQLISPADGETNVAFTPLLTWAAVPNADGYLISIGSTSGGVDVLDNADIGNTTSTFVIDFEAGVTYYVTIIPYNLAGQAEGCIETSFTTSLGCGPYIDPDTGVLIDNNPQISLLDTYNLCLNEGLLMLTQTEGDEIYWYQVVNEAYIEIAQGSSVTIDTAGAYLLSAQNQVTLTEGTLSCEQIHEFTVTVSDAPEITGLEINNAITNFNVVVNVAGDGAYEYANSIDGPYQDSNQFLNQNLSDITFYVRDKNGCGSDSQRIVRDLGFPKYFTPNNDGINDYWQVRGIEVNGERIREIQIFDRFGKMITQFSPFDRGWDGTLQGNRMLDNTYWFLAKTESNVVFKGYFALRR